MRLQDKVAIVTGSSKGIGEGIARVFSQEGAKVVITCRTERMGQKMADELGVKPLFSILDYAEVSQPTKDIATVPGLRALGQLIAYPILYQQTFSPNQMLVPLLIAEVLQADIRPVLISEHLTYELYPPPIGQIGSPKDGEHP